MRAVGIRELKNKLSEYLRLVSAGEEIVVTDRGKPVARIGPPERGDVLPEGLEILVRRGELTRGRRNDPGLYRRMKPIGRPGLTAELLDWVRGDR